MLRNLEDIANATPKDYLSHSPSDPIKLASMMVNTASQKFPVINRDDGVDRMQNYEFLYVGPGAGLVVKALIEQSHVAFGLETSRRGIASAPDEIRSYILWGKPWESPFPSKFTTSESGQQKVRPMFHVAVINKYLKELLTQDEWQDTLKEIKKIARYAAILAV